MSMRFEWLVNKAPFTGFLSPKGIEKMSTIRPKNWDDFQHYKNRRPIWIKLHRTLLDDFDFHGLPLASRALAPMLWLLAGDYEQAKIPLDYAMLGFRFRMSTKEAEQAIKPLIDKGFFNLCGDASDLLAECLPREEKRREETEGETEKKREEHTSGTSVPNCPHLEIIEAYNSILGQQGLPIVRPGLWAGSKREIHLRARWKEDPSRQTVDFWERFFAYVAKSDFLMGRVDGQRTWRADLGWLINRENFDKVFQGNYHE